MTVSILAKPFSWSFSRIKNYETCPRRYHEIDVLKNFREAKSKELQDGFLVHEAMAKRVEHGVTLPSNMPFEKWALYALEEPGRVYVEQELGITSKFKPCAYHSKNPPIWLRAKIDVVKIHGHRAHIIDWKTGQVKPDMTQLMLAALVVMAHHPQVFDIKAELVWLAYDTSTVEEFTVDDVVAWWGSDMGARQVKLQQAHDGNHFPPKTSGLCRRHCPVVSCEHCGAS